MSRLVWVETNIEVVETFDPKIPTGVNKSPGAVNMRFLRYDGDDVPEGYEVTSVEFLQRKRG